MTRLFNLESYVECCYHARLFHQQSEKLIPQKGDLPTAYKALLQKYANYPYIPELISDSTCPQEFVINPASLNYLLIGNELNQEDNQRLFIIRDTVDLLTLSTSNLLERRDGYLYSSAYHYWNHHSEISQHNLTKPLVFIDLDSFGCDRLISINFATTNNSQYIPILDTREKEPIAIDSKYNFIETSNNIYQSIARWILDEQFPAIAQNFDTVTTLAKYLQKVSFFQNIQQYINQDDFEFIIEILHQNQIFYKQVTLSISTIAEIVSQKINAQYLKQIASVYPQYQFALISQYNIFPKIQGLLPEFICLSPINQEFTKIWQEKSQLKFPLFGIYLDTIEFAVGIRDEAGNKSKQWIQLSNQEDAISYEGKLTVLIGRISSTNQDSFRIKTGKQTKLPIKVNGKDYCKNDVPQYYILKVENPQEGVEDVYARIEFHLQPGAFPELAVIDLEGKHKITNYLTNKVFYSHIPIETILSTRKQESLNQINLLKNYNGLEQFKGCLLQLAIELDQIGHTSNKPAHYQRLKNSLNDARQHIYMRNNHNFDLLQFIDASSNDTDVSYLRTQLQNKSFDKIAVIISQSLNSDSHSVLSLVQQDLLVEAIMFTGKTYKFSQYLLPTNLFSQHQISKAGQIRHRNLGNEYLQCLSRIAVNEQLQKEYFSWFDSYYKLEATQYLWGYGRILLWYYNFDSAIKSLDYRTHFTAMMEYLLNKPPERFSSQYKQNAFLSLLYLLIFRATDKSFCQHDSSEMRMAERVINHFSRDKTIFSRQVSRSKPLNQFFQEMIEGTATEDDLDDLVEVG